MILVLNYILKTSTRGTSRFQFPITVCFFSEHKFRIQGFPRSEKEQYDGKCTLFIAAVTSLFFLFWLSHCLSSKFLVDKENIEWNQTHIDFSLVTLLLSVQIFSGKVCSTVISLILSCQIYTYFVRKLSSAKFAILLLDPNGTTEMKQM